MHTARSHLVEIRYFFAFPFVHLLWQAALQSPVLTQAFLPSFVQAGSHFLSAQDLAQHSVLAFGHVPFPLSGF